MSELEQQLKDRSVTDRELINQVITDRSDCFYWQTDRPVDPSVAGSIFAKRHELISDDELTLFLKNILNEVINVADLEVVPRSDDDQTNLGNVNAVRTIRAGDKEYIIRTHPRDLPNGYFWAEKVASELARQHGLPAYQTVYVHDLEPNHPCAFMVIEKMPGLAQSVYISNHNERDADLAKAAGEMMARLHKVEVKGYGFFDNNLAKTNKLKGIKDSYKAHILAALSFNLRVLQERMFIDESESAALNNLFSNSDIPNISQATIVHNDFADWNLLTDGKQITGILDWDECHAGDPIADLGCWTTFYDMQRFEPFLEGYKKVAKLPSDFEERLWFYRLRFLVSKLTLRSRRLAWDHSHYRKMLEKKVASGRNDMKEAMKKLNLT